jgi:hypothetical protein
MDKDIFLFSSSGAEPVSYTMGTGSYSPGGEADHSHPSSAEIKELIEIYFHPLMYSQGSG